MSVSTTPPINTDSSVPTCTCIVLTCTCIDSSVPTCTCIDSSVPTHVLTQVPTYMYMCSICTCTCIHFETCTAYF